MKLHNWWVLLFVAFLFSSHLWKSCLPKSFSHSKDIYSNSTYELLGFLDVWCFSYFMVLWVDYTLESLLSFTLEALVLIMLCCFFCLNCTLAIVVYLNIWSLYYFLVFFPNVLEPLEVQRNFICFHLLASKNNQEFDLLMRSISWAMTNQWQSLS
jgi:hypothetical protein